jgi:hypothetical protein
MPMPMVKFTLIDGAPIWTHPDKVVAVQRSPLRFGSGPKELEPASTSVSITIAVGWS